MLIRKYLPAFGLGVLICSPHFSGGTRALVPQAQAGETCPGAPQERYRVSVRIETPPPMVNHNLNRAELTWTSLHGMGDNVFGLHIQGTKVEYKAKYAAEPDKDGYCFWVRAIDVLLRYETPDIYVAREYRVGGCNYREILGHEMHHEKVARQVIKQYVRRFRSALTSLLIPKPKSAILVSSREDGKRKVNALLQKVIRPVYMDFRADLARQQAAVDAPDEYRKVRRRCKRW